MLRLLCVFFRLCCYLRRSEWSKLTWRSWVHLHGQAETASVRGAVSHHKCSCFLVLYQRLSYNEFDIRQSTEGKRCISGINAQLGSTERRF